MDPCLAAALGERAAEREIDLAQGHDIRLGVAQLGLGEGAARPVREALLLADASAQEIAHQRAVARLLAEAERHGGELGVKEGAGEGAVEAVEDL